MQLQGSLVRDMSRAPIGRVQKVLLDPDSLDARWLQVTVDADQRIVLVPAAAASEVAAGELLVPYPSETILAAVHVEGRSLDEAGAEQLMRLYGFGA